MSIAFEWDPNKSRTNKERHGVDFERAQMLWMVPHVFYPLGDVYGESRYLISAELAGRIYVAVFTHRGPLIRLISCHKADARWQREHRRKMNEA